MLITSDRPSLTTSKGHPQASLPAALKPGKSGIESYERAIRQFQIPDRILANHRLLLLLLVLKFLEVFQSGGSGANDRKGGKFLRSGRIGGRHCHRDA